MDIIITLVLGFIVICLVYGIVGFLMVKFPALIWIIGVAGGIIVGILSSHWWLGILVGFFLIGILSHAQSIGGHKCAHCGSFDTDVTEKVDGHEIWTCNKCHNVTIGRKH